MKIKLLDRDGDTVSMTTEQIAESIRKMGNVDGRYGLIPQGWSIVDDDPKGNSFKLRADYRATRADILSIYSTFHEVDIDGSGKFTHCVLQFLAFTMPRYSWLQKKRKEWRHNRKQRAIEKAFKANNPLNLIWEPTPFVLEMPWLRLKGKKAVTIGVKDERESWTYEKEMDAVANDLFDIGANVFKTPESD